MLTRAAALAWVWNAGFGQQPRAVIDKPGLALRGVLFNAPAQRVVAVGGDALRGFGLDEPVVAVVAVAGDELPAGAPALFDEVARVVVGVVAVAEHDEPVALHQPARGC